MKRLISSVVLGGAAAATYLSVGVAAADPSAVDVMVPQPFGFSLDGVLDPSYVASNASQAIAYGSGTIDFDAGDINPAVQQFFFDNVELANGNPLPSNFAFDNIPVDIINKLDGLGTQQQILFGEIPGTNIDSGVIGIHDYGSGYGYAYIDMVGPGVESVNSNGVDHAVGAFVVTPAGLIDVSNWENGGDYFGLAYLESQLFDFSKPLDNPFGIVLTPGTADFLYQTGGVLGNTSYGSQEVNFIPSDLEPFARDFLTDNGVNLQQFSDALNAEDAAVNIINTVNYTGIGNGLTMQQLFLPDLGDTNVENGVITLYNLGAGFDYSSIDLDLSGSTPDAIGAWLSTPFGDIDVSSFASLVAQVFGPEYFDIGNFPLDDMFEPTFNFLF